VIRLAGTFRAAALIVACAASAAPIASAQFESRSTTPIGNRPLSIAVGDFNRDGIKDLAVADGVCVWILLGNGDGTFRSSSFKVGISPQSLATADLNHDGVLDLVVADYLGGIIYVLLGNGDGTFEATPAAKTIEAPTFVGLADVNGDHQLDLVVINPPFISIFLSTGKGTFVDSQDIEMPFVPNGVAWGDFDNNGTLDLAVAGFSGSINRVGILRGNGDGTFRFGPAYDVGAEPSSVAVADLRGIGTLDLAVADFQGGGISVLLGNGDGTFQAPALYATSFPKAVVAADVNGDGIPDLVAAVEDVHHNNQRSGASVFLGNGDGTFQAPRSYPSGSFAWSVAVADLNGDEQTDVILGAKSAQFEVDVLLNTGVVSFSPTTPLQFPAQLIGTVSAPQTVTLTNTGSSALTISAMALKGPFIMTTSCGSTVAAGASCSIASAFQPKARGFVSGSISIQDSASSKLQVVELSGAGTVVSFSSQQLTFPPQEVGTVSAPQQVLLTNTGKVGLDIAGIAIEGRNVPDFLEADDCGRHLPAGASCTISVKFSPKKTGPLLASVSVWDDGGGAPQQVALSGTGK